MISELDDVKRTGNPLRAVCKTGVTVGYITKRESTSELIGGRYAPIDNANNLAFKNTDEYGDEWDWMYVHCPSTFVAVSQLPKHGDTPCLYSMHADENKTQLAKMGIPLKRSDGTWSHWHVAATDNPNRVLVSHIYGAAEPREMSINTNLQSDAYYGFPSYEGYPLSKTIAQALAMGTATTGSKPLYVKIHDMREDKALLSLCASHEQLNENFGNYLSNYYALVYEPDNGTPPVRVHALIDRHISNAGISPIALLELYLDHNDEPVVRTIYDHDYIAGRYIYDVKNLQNSPIAEGTWWEGVSFAESVGQCIDFWYKEDGTISTLKVNFRYDAGSKYYRFLDDLDDEPLEIREQYPYRNDSYRWSSAKMTMLLDGVVVSEQSASERVDYNDSTLVYSNTRDGVEVTPPVVIQSPVFVASWIRDNAIYPGFFGRVPRRGDECRMYFGSARLLHNLSYNHELTAEIPNIGLYARSNGSKTGIAYSVIEYPAVAAVGFTTNRKTVKVGAIVSPRLVTTIPEFTDIIPVRDQRYYMFYNQPLDVVWYGWTLGYIGSKINARVCQLTGILGEGDINYAQLYVNFR